MININASVHLPDTDAAGILFFGNYFKLAHDAYEALMESIGFSLQRIITSADFLVLIAHAEADYKKPLRLGDKFSVQLTVDSIKKSSFILSYSLKDAQNATAARLKTVHVTVDKKNGDKVPLPEKLQKKLGEVS